MGLRRKITLWFAGVLAALAFTGYVGLGSTLQPAFDDLEERSSLADLARVRHNLEHSAEMLSKFTVDWAQWDETYRYMTGDNPDFANINIEPDSLAGIDINFMLLYDVDSQLHTGLLIDIASREPQPIDSLAINVADLETLRSHEALGQEIHGFVDTGLGLMLVSSRPITRSDITGPAVGTLMMGRLLDDARIYDIGNDAEVNFSVVPATSEDRFVQSGEIFGRIIRRVDPADRTNEQLVHSVRGESLARLRVTSSREVSALGQTTTASVLLMFIGLGALATVVLAMILRGVIIKPVSKLRAMMAHIEQSEDVSLRIAPQRKDEIGDLATSFDSMLDKLEKMKQQNIEQSFKAGIAEVAAGLLHNVRNALMPALNNVAMAREAMIQRSDKNVALAIEEIGDPGTGAERRAKLLQFLRTSHERSVRDRAAAVDYLGDVLDQLDGAADAVREQEKFANSKPVVEQVKLGEVLDIALAVIPAEVLTGIAVEIEPEARGIRVSAHRVPLMQVVGNVLLNAVDSILATGSSLGRISMDARRVDGGSKVALTIRDDGGGMSDAELEQLFDRDYASSEGANGHSLHWSANTLAGMGSTISASSEGPGRGTEFRILLRATKPGTTRDG